MTFGIYRTNNVEEVTDFSIGAPLFATCFHMWSIIDPLTFF